LFDALSGAPFEQSQNLTDYTSGGADNIGIVECDAVLPGISWPEASRKTLRIELNETGPHRAVIPEPH